MDVASQLLLANKPLSTGGTDPYFDNVVLYLKGDDTNGSTNIIDSSPTPKTITVNGTVQISTAQSKYGGSSILLNGGYLTTSSSAFNLESQDFCIELWYYQISQQSFTSIINWDGQDYPLCLYHGTSVNTGNPMFKCGTATSWFVEGLSFGALSAGWNHLTVNRMGNTFKTFTNGTKIEEITTAGTIGDSGIIAIGRNGIRNLNAYIDSLRVTVGVARYTSNFNPETDTFMS